MYSNMRVSALNTGIYSMSFEVASATNSGSFRLVTGGYGCGFFASDLTGLVAVPSTGGFRDFVDLEV